MNNRLQAGGLALIIKGDYSDLNVGKTVELTSYLGKFRDIDDAWFVYCEDGLSIDGGTTGNEGAIASHRLMPLGDKQTQDELAKELEDV